MKYRLDIRGRCTEELNGQVECSTIHKLCSSAMDMDVFLDSSMDAK